MPLNWKLGKLFAYYKLLKTLCLAIIKQATLIPNRQTVVCDQHWFKLRLNSYTEHEAAIF